MSLSAAVWLASLHAHPGCAIQTCIADVSHHFHPLPIHTDTDYLTTLTRESMADITITEISLENTLLLDAINKGKARFVSDCASYLQVRTDRGWAVSSEV